MAAAILLLCGLAAAASRKAKPPALQPTEVVIARRSFFDFGPPYSYYDLFFLAPQSGGLNVESVSLAGSADDCIAAPSLDVASGKLTGDIGDLFGGLNLCAIPKKKLSSKPKPCRRCLVFSGAEIVVRFRCGGESREMRGDLLDRDLFGGSTPSSEKAALSLNLMSRLAEAVGPGPVATERLFPVEHPLRAETAESPAMLALKAGEFDKILPGASEKLSEIYAALAPVLVRAVP